MISKQALIETIREQNPTAGTEFLTRFDVTALENYLSHLSFRTTPRSADGAWVRTPQTPAIAMCVRAA